MLFLPLLFSYSYLVVNSHDWRVVYVAGYYAELKGYRWFFIYGGKDPQFISRFIPDNSHVVLVESQPYGDIRSFLVAKNCSVDVISGDYAEVEHELWKRSGLSEVMVFPDWDPRPALGCGFLAYNRGAFPWFSNGSVSPPAEGVVVGHFPPRLVDGWPIKERIEGDINTECIQQSLKLKPTKHAYGINGKYLEQSIITGGGDPVIFLGMDQLRNGIINRLKAWGIQYITLVGYEAVPLGQRIREQSNRTIGVIVKFGQSYTGIPQIEGKVYALDLFRLPDVYPDVWVEAAYVSNGSLYIVVNNNGTHGYFFIKNPNYTSPVEHIYHGESMALNISLSEMPNVIPITIWMGDSPDDLYRRRDQNITPGMIKWEDAGNLTATHLTYDGKFLRLHLVSDTSCEERVVVRLHLSLEGEERVIILSGTINKEGTLVKRMDIAPEDMGQNVTLDIKYGCGFPYKMKRQTLLLERPPNWWWLLILPLVVLLWLVIKDQFKFHQGK